MALASYPFCVVVYCSATPCVKQLKLFVACECYVDITTEIQVTERSAVSEGIQVSLLPKKRKQFVRQIDEVAPSDVSPWPPYSVFSSDNIYGACIGQNVTPFKEIRSSIFVTQSREFIALPLQRHSPFVFLINPQ